MATPKRVLLAAGALSAIGVLLRVFGISWGLDVLLIGVLVAVASVSFALRSIQNELATSRRTTAQRLSALSERHDELRDTLEEHEKLQRTTLFYAKNGSAGPGRETADRDSASTTAQPAGLAGRASTPEVTNSGTGLSFAALLMGDSTVVLPGLLSSEAAAALPDSVRFVPLIPFHAAEALVALDSTRLVVLDEAVFSTAPWDRAVGPAGIGMMTDLVTALTRAEADGAQIVILRHRHVPDIHDTALSRLRALRLPPSEADRVPAAGAPATPVIAALARFTEERESR